MFPKPKFSVRFLCSFNLSSCPAKRMLLHVTNLIIMYCTWHEFSRYIMYRPLTSLLLRQNIYLIVFFRTFATYVQLRVSGISWSECLKKSNMASARGSHNFYQHLFLNHTCLLPISQQPVFRFTKRIRHFPFATHCLLYVIQETPNKYTGWSQMKWAITLIYW
jgi:hypothetical protein